MFAGGELYLGNEEVPVMELRPPSDHSSPTLPAHYRHASPSRQASPYPIGRAYLSITYFIKTFGLACLLL